MCDGDDGWDNTDYGGDGDNACDDDDDGIDGDDSGYRIDGNFVMPMTNGRWR